MQRTNPGFRPTSLPRLGTLEVLGGKEETPGLTQTEIDAFAEMLTSDVKSLLTNKTPMDEFVENLNFPYDAAAPAECQRYLLEKAIIASLRDKEWPTEIAKDLAARHINLIWAEISKCPDAVKLASLMAKSVVKKVKAAKGEHVHTAECNHE
jgi:hypothetical protein